VKGLLSVQILRKYNGRSIEIFQRLTDEMKYGFQRRMSGK
jgi:hypothetical protein